MRNQSVWQDCSVYSAASGAAAAGGGDAFAHQFPSQAEPERGFGND